MTRSRRSTHFGARRYAAMLTALAVAMMASQPLTGADCLIGPDRNFHSRGPRPPRAE